MIWLPYESFQLSAKALDPRTLTIQRYEVWRVLQALRYGTGLNDQPVMRMWRSYPTWLAAYGVALCSEFGAANTELAKLFRRYIDVADVTDKYPPWLGDALVHLSHRSNMIRIAPDHYQPMWPGVVEGMPIAWPVEEED